MATDTGHRRGKLRRKQKFKKTQKEFAQMALQEIFTKYLAKDIDPHLLKTRNSCKTVSANVVFRRSRRLLKAMQEASN